MTAKFHNLILSLLLVMIASCSDGMDRDNIYLIDGSSKGYTKFPTLIRTGTVNPSDIEIRCRRSSDSAFITLNDTMWMEDIVYVSWYDMDALTTQRQYDENYTLILTSAPLWGETVRTIRWDVNVYHSRLFPQACYLDNQEIEPNYNDILCIGLPLISLTRE